MQTYLWTAVQRVRRPGPRPSRPASRASESSTPTSVVAFAMTSLAVLLTLSACSKSVAADDQLGSAPSTIEVAAVDVETPTQSTTSTSMPPTVNSLAINADETDPSPVVSDSTQSTVVATADADWEATPPTDSVPAPELSEPDEAIEEIATELASTSTDVSGQDEALDAVEPLDRKAQPDEVVDLRRGSRVNETGEQNIFDETANLACADVEVALTALDEDRLDEAGAHVGSAATRAGQSAIKAVQQWQPALEQSADQIAREGSSDLAPLLAFLSTCTQGGYEL